MRLPILAFTVLVSSLSLLHSVSPTPTPRNWGKFEGHRIVCEIVWQEMGSAAKAAVQALLATDSEYDYFADSCEWADNAREDGTHPEYDDAHFVNARPGDSDVDIAQHCADPDNPCVMQAINQFREVLASNSGTAEDKREALKFLAHFVGDIHQPLHAGYESDYGGGGVDVLFFGSEYTLHSVWDTQIIRKAYREYYEGLAGWRDYAIQLQEDIAPIDRTLWTRTLDPEDWADESFSFVETEVYFGSDGALDWEYFHLNLFIVERQLKKAGVRLAAILDAVFA